MVGRRLIIYIVSLAFMVGAFLWIKTQFFASPATLTGHRLKPVAIPSGTGGSNLVLVDRAKNGRLLYVLRFRRAIPKGHGEYHLVKPRMKFYSGRNNAILVTSDYGDVSVDQLGGPLSNHVYPRKGRLFGHVTITVGPVDTFVKGAVHRRKGQFRITLGRPIHFNYQQGLLTSRGSVLVHSDRLAFSGRRLTCELNVATKKLDYLQIAHGDYLVMKNINAAGSTAAAPSRPSGTKKISTSKPLAAGTPSAQPHRKISRKSSPKRAPNATTLPSLAAPARSPLSGSVYGLVFTEKVRVKIGAQTLAAHRLRLYFSSARRTGGTMTNGSHMATTRPASIGQSTHSLSPGPHPTIAKNAGPITAPISGQPQKMRHNVPVAGGKNLVVHWDGSLVLRPVRSRHVDLANSQDVILQAFGRSQDPVIMHDGSTRVGYASVVRYHVATRRLRMDATGLAPIKFVDAQFGTIVCRKLLYRSNSGRITLTGPGQALYTQKKSNRNPWRGTWQNRMQITMAKSSRGKSRIKSLRLSGHAEFYNALFRLKAHAMHATFDAGKGGSATLRQFTARGNVRLRSAVGPKLARPANKVRRYDTLAANRLVLSTAINPRSQTRQPSKLYAVGGVDLVFHQLPNASSHGFGGGGRSATSGLGNSSRVYHLQAQYLRAAIQDANRSISPAAKPATSALLSGSHFTVGRFHAWQHVSLTISGGVQPIRATCSDLRGDRNTKLASLTGNIATGTPARIAEEDNWIASQKIELNGDSQDLNIPEAGQLHLASHTHGQAATNLLVNWKGRMYFRNKRGEATFFSHVVAKLVGQPRRKSQLSAPVLRVMLSGRKKHQLHVSEIYAFTSHKGQHVEAEDVSYNTAKLIDTRLFLHCLSLRYNAEKQHLLVAGKGELSLENYRRAAKAASAHKPANRGQSAFEWRKKLDYRAATGRLALSGGVRLVYRPMRPFVLSRSIAGAYTGPNKGLILLDASKLIARLLRSAKASSGGVALGMGGPAKLKSVQAYKAALELSGARLTADVLAFDARRQIAKAYSAAGRDAHITTPDGKLNAAAREIIWRLSKSTQSAITLEQPRASGSVP